MIVAKISFCFAGMIGGVLTLLIGGMVVAGATWLRSDEIAFVSYRDFNADIFIIDVDHALSYNLTHDGAYDIAPAWSPDGEWIAFASDRGGRRSIYLMDRFGGSVRRLTGAEGVYTLPRWSADGRSLIFVSINEAPNGIYSIGMDGSSFRRLDDPENPRAHITLDLAYDPGDISRARSPDGNQVAFMTYRDQGWGIYVSQDANRKDARLLVNVGRFTEAPVWSPDSKRVAYIAHRDGVTDLFMIDVGSDSAPRRLTFNRDLDISPVWRP